MTLSNQILKALRHGVAKNGKIVMERVSADNISRCLWIDIRIVKSTIVKMARDGLLGEEIIDGELVYWRKGKGCA